MQRFHLFETVAGNSIILIPGVLRFRLSIKQQIIASIAKLDSRKKKNGETNPMEFYEHQRFRLSLLHPFQYNPEILS